MKPKIVIAGGSGFIGQLLVDYYRRENYEVVVLTRDARLHVPGVRFVKWDGKNMGSWVSEIEGCEAVINLSGKSVNCRPTNKNKKEIIDSRVNSTVLIGKAIHQSKSPPRVWINAGGVGVFSGTERFPKDENAALGTNFSADVARLWEEAFLEAETPYTRKVFLRIALVLKKGQGFLQPLELLVRMGLGGKMGNGKQYFPWIHHLDLIRIFDHAVQNPEIAGIIHASSPETVMNAAFMRQLRKTLGMAFGIPAPALAVRIGAWLLGTNGELALSDNYAVPGRLQKARYPFLYPDLESALSNLYHDL